MADDKKKVAKSETLTIRLDQKTRFMLEFMARLKGQSLTTVVERAIVDAANNTTISSGSSGGYPRSWSSFWDVEEGIRVLKMADEPELYPTYEEDIILDFARAHWQFFYHPAGYSGSSPDYNAPRRGFIRIIWPRLREFLDIWNASKTTDYYAAGRAIKSALKQNGLAVPEWPPVAPVERGNPKPADDLDDEIPF